MKRKIIFLKNIFLREKTILFLSFFIFSLFLLLPQISQAVPLIYLYEHTWYGGNWATFFQDHPDFNGLPMAGVTTWNDQASSLKVPSGWPAGLKVTLYQHTWYGGKSLLLTADHPNFNAISGPSTQGTWNDVASSIRVCEDYCSSYGARQCTDNTHYDQCGSYDDDNCIEWSNPPTACPSGQTCSGAGVCSTTSTDTTFPTSSITSPSAGSSYSSNFSVSVTDSDTGGSGLAACYFHVLDIGLGQWTATWRNRACNSSFSVTVGSAGYCKSQGSNICEVWAFAKDGAGNIGTSSKRKFSISQPTTNHAPNTPSQPSGPTLGNINTSYTYSTSTTDPDSGDTIKYGWDWDGNGTVDEWSGLKTSGATDSRSHSWAGEGTFNVKVKACDNKNACSGWSPSLAVTIKVPKLPVLCNCEPSEGYYKICYYGGTNGYLNPNDCIKESTISGPSLEYNWGTGSIIPNDPRTDNISGTWRGYFNFTEADYQLDCPYVDDGIIVKIGDKEVYREFADDGSVYAVSCDNPPILHLSGRTKIEIIWNEKGGNAALKVNFKRIEKNSPVAALKSLDPHILDFEEVCRLQGNCTLPNGQYLPSQYRISMYWAGCQYSMCGSSCPWWKGLKGSADGLPDGRAIVWTTYYVETAGAGACGLGVRYGETTAADTGIFPCGSHLNIPSFNANTIVTDRGCYVNGHELDLSSSGILSNVWRLIGY